MDDRSKQAWEGWSIVGAVAVALILLVTMEAMMAAGPAAGVRGIIRATACSSFILLALACTAAAVCYFWPNAWTRWQLRNRRYLGVSFALSHFVHLLAIFALGEFGPAELVAAHIPLAALAVFIAGLQIAARISKARARDRHVSPAS